MGSTVQPHKKYWYKFQPLGGPAKNQNPEFLRG
jgi:hypothetical protein